MLLESSSEATDSCFVSVTIIISLTILIIYRLISTVRSRRYSFRLLSAEIVVEDMIDPNCVLRTHDHRVIVSCKTHFCLSRSIFLANRIEPKHSLDNQMFNVDYALILFRHPKSIRVPKKTDQSIRNVSRLLRRFERSIDELRRELNLITKICFI